MTQTEKWGKVVSLQHDIVHPCTNRERTMNINELKFQICHFHKPFSLFISSDWFDATYFSAAYVDFLRIQDITQWFLLAFCKLLSFFMIMKTFPSSIYLYSFLFYDYTANTCHQSLVMDAADT